MNRFTWDMRSIPPHVFPNLIMYQASVRGPVLPPGKYEVKLMAGGTTVSRTFTIARDTRVTNIIDEQLQKQFQMARQVEEKFSLTNDTVVRFAA